MISTIVNTLTRTEQSFRRLSDTSFTPPDSLEANTSYSWRVTARAVPSTGSTQVTDTSAGTFAITSSTQPTVTLFYQNFPDPFGRGQRSDQTCFWFDLDRAATVRLTIFDIRLRQVRQIVPGPIGNGVLGIGAYGRHEHRLAQRLRSDASRGTAATTAANSFRPASTSPQFVANGKSTTIKMMYKGPP